MASTVGASCVDSGVCGFPIMQVADRLNNGLENQLHRIVQDQQTRKKHQKPREEAGSIELLQPLLSYCEAT